jgi:hypothetical protein
VGFECVGIIPGGNGGKSQAGAIQGMQDALQNHNPTVAFMVMQENYFVRKYLLSPGRQGLTSVILATQEAETIRIMV